MKFRLLAMTDIINIDRESSLTFINDTELHEKLSLCMTFTIYDDKVIIKADEEKMKILLESFPEDFTTKIVAIVKEYSIIPLLMIDMGMINRTTLHSSSCNLILQDSLGLLKNFKLPDHYSDNWEFIRYLNRHNSASISSLYYIHDSEVRIHISDKGEIVQFFKGAANSYRI